MCLAILLVFVGVLNFWNASRASAWPTTQGKITRSEIPSHQRDEKERYYYLSLRYSYEVNGKSFEGKRISYGDWHTDAAEDDFFQNVIIRVVALFSGHWRKPKNMYGSTYVEDILAVGGQFPLGEQVAVYYNPQNPSESLLGPEGSADSYRAIILGIIFFFLALFRAGWTMLRG